MVSCAIGGDGTLWYPTSRRLCPGFVSPITRQCCGWKPSASIKTTWLKRARRSLCWAASTPQLGRRTGLAGGEVPLFGPHHLVDPDIRQEGNRLVIIILACP